MLKISIPGSVLISFALLFASCSHQLAPPGHYQNEPITIDGNINDWVLPLRFSNADYTMHYSVTNDDKNIYICVYSKSQTWQRRMLKSGMSIYFDSKGEKNKTCALIFPIKKTSGASDMASLNSTRPNASAACTKSARPPNRCAGQRGATANELRDRGTNLG